MAGGATEKESISARLLNLTLVLSTTRFGLLKRELFAVIKGYQDALKSDEQSAAIEKMFERDKATLRDLGIQIEVIEEDDDNTKSRYRLIKSNFAWPKDFHLSPTEVALLNAAGDVWRQAAFSVETAQAIDRIRAHGDPADDASLLGYSPKIQTHDASFAPINQAIENRVTAVFSYRNPDGTVKERRLEPWLLRNESGQWMVTGWDTSVTEADKTRNFLLKRIVSEITLRSDLSFAKPEQDKLTHATVALQKHIDSNVAEILVLRDSTAYSHFGLNEPGNSQWVRNHFNFMDRWLLADELREYAKELRVIAPAELVKTYKEGFEKLAAQHD